MNEPLSNHITQGVDEFGEPKLYVKDVKQALNELLEDYKTRLCQTAFTEERNRDKGIRAVAFELLEEVIKQKMGSLVK